MQTRHVGERLRRWRRQRNLTLDEVASRAGCSPSMVSKIETRKAEASLTTSDMNNGSICIKERQVPQDQV